MLIVVQPIRDFACSYKDKNNKKTISIYLPRLIIIELASSNDKNIYLHGGGSTLCEKVPMLELNQG